MTAADLPADDPAEHNGYGANGHTTQAGHLNGSSNLSTADQLEAALVDLVRRWTEDQLEGGNEVALHERLLSIIEPPLMQVTYDRSGQQYLAAARRLGLHRTTVKKKLEG